MKGEVLFLAHRIPFPPDRGDKIRSNHLLKAIAALAPVHVGCLADDETDLAQEGDLATLAASHCLVRRSTPLPLAALRAVAAGKPVSLTAFDSARLHRWVRTTLATRPIAAIFVFSGQMAQYVPADFAGRVVMDFVDVDSAKFEAYAAAGSLPARLVYGREARLLASVEEAAARRAAASLFVSPQEKSLFEQRLVRPQGIAVQALGNGIDAAFWNPEGVIGSPELAQGGPHIVFTGQMDYPPNVEAVTVFARDVMPMVRAVHPQACFHIVGRAPTGAVRALAGVNGTQVTGAVPDVRPWLAGASLVTAPLAIARGVQNKVLEAMAMARPVLLTTAAATGIPATDGAHFVIADGAPALAARALALLADPAAAQAMGRAARAFVLQSCAWESVLAPLPCLLWGTADAA
ncbi:TIGR03087 family PEP-CTERM/XrtA system glycosyltransferase [Novosphingobium cyanobacteriorum]|uniref:TIGR03087 family PEP-CTERM/XrtA system glycosyltransferase n=1 Tax=Novosphingobium cyanobacteriorum TaxID=3024215 RepID=A0ABT6CEA4_9SPHN|nr:TIGR03087 family PEP-CTERM/XrtA system glycosyltransferase [Novosphingobium cyanobacteriorum]MDF8332240.1 TIGR03087 family PEP-CTERM/XrtA system glycosyltransferase [Novosphingobium cyanobacteriorum]